MPDLSLLVNLLQLVVRDRTQLAQVNIVLRHQLAVCKRSVKSSLAFICVAMRPGAQKGIS